MQRRIWAATLLFWIATVTPAIGQTGNEAGGQTRFQATRQELQELLARYEQSARSGAYSAQLRARARYEASLIKQRLDHGDFQVGDRISLVVEGEPTLSDTLVVGPDTAAVLPSGEKLSLQRVLRSEVQDRLRQAVAKVVKEPVVHAQTFLRLGILGAVGTQGFYLVRSDAVITDVLMNAGGPNQTADLTHIRVERDRQKIWEGEPLQEAMTEGRTIDQLSLRAGDLIVVPAQKGSTNIGNLARTALFSIPALLALFRLVSR